MDGFVPCGHDRVEQLLRVLLDGASRACLRVDRALLSPRMSPPADTTSAFVADMPWSSARRFIRDVNDKRQVSR